MFWTIDSKIVGKHSFCSKQYFPFTFDTMSNSDFSSNEIRGTIFQSEGAELETSNVYHLHILNDIQRRVEFLRFV